MMEMFKIIFKVILIYSVLVTGCRGIFGDRDQPESIVQVPIEASNIKINSPVHGLVFHPGDTISIKWIAPTINRIDIQLYRKSEFKFTIIENFENLGRFDWVLPTNIPLSNHYLIKISSQTNPDIYNFSGRFGIQ